MALTTQAQVLAREVPEAAPVGQQDHSPPQNSWRHELGSSGRRQASPGPPSQTQHSQRPARRAARPNQSSFNKSTYVAAFPAVSGWTKSVKVYLEEVRGKRALELPSNSYFLWEISKFLKEVKLMFQSRAKFDFSKRCVWPGEANALGMNGGHEAQALRGSLCLLYTPPFPLSSRGMRHRDFQTLGSEHLWQRQQGQL